MFRKSPRHDCVNPDGWVGRGCGSQRVCRPCDHGQPRRTHLQRRRRNDVCCFADPVATHHQQQQRRQRQEPNMMTRRRRMRRRRMRGISNCVLPIFSTIFTAEPTSAGFARRTTATLSQEEEEEPQHRHLFPWSKGSTPCRSMRARTLHRPSNYRPIQCLSQGRASARVKLNMVDQTNVGRNGCEQ